MSSSELWSDLGLGGLTPASSVRTVEEDVRGQGAERKARRRPHPERENSDDILDGGDREAHELDSLA
jgi:hypothetical protein